MTPNNRVNLTVRPVTAIANGAIAAPVRPAGYAARWTDNQEGTCSSRCSWLLF